MERLDSYRYRPDWTLNTEAVFRKTQRRHAETQIHRCVQHAPAEALPVNSSRCTDLSWGVGIEAGEAGSLDKLVTKACSVVGLELDSGEKDEGQDQSHPG